MIQISTKYVDGVSFISDFKFVPPYETRNGVRVELVSYEMSRNAKTIAVLKSLRLKKVGRDFSTREDIYALPLDFVRIKVALAFVKVYWTSLWWVYDNMRVFKRIPEGSMFSWKYFIPYCWIQSLRRKIDKG